MLTSTATAAPSGINTPHSPTMLVTVRDISFSSTSNSDSPKASLMTNALASVHSFPILDWVRSRAATAGSETISSAPLLWPFQRCLLERTHQ